MTDAKRRRVARLAWPALLTLLLAVGTLLALTLFQDFAADLRLERGRTTQQMQLITEIVSGQLQGDRYEEIEPLLGSIGGADDTIAAIELQAPNGFVIAGYQRQRPVERAFELETPIAYSYHRAAVLRLTADLSGVYTRDRRLALQLAAIYATGCLLLALLTYIALQRAQEAARLRLTDARLRETNRTLQVLSDCNQALVRAVREQDLMDDMCRILVERGGYQLAWIGLAELDAQRRVRCVASCGATDYLEGIELSWGRGDSSLGPTGTAIRTGRTVINRDTRNNAAMWAWRDEAIGRGLRSSIALPLGSGEPALGALNIYAAEADRFDADEVRLLEELAGDLGYGLQSLRNEALRREAEAVIERQGERFQALVESSGDGVVLSDASGTIDYAGPSLTQILGRAPAAIAGRSAFEWVHDADQSRIRDALRECLATPRHPIAVQARVRHHDGDWRTIEGSLTNLLDDPAVERIVVNFRDVTRRLALEAAQQQANERFEQIAANVSEVFWVSDVSGFALLYVSPAYERIWQRSIPALQDDPEQWLDAIHPEDRRRIRRAIAEKQALGTFAEEYRIVRPDGSIRWIHDRAFPVRDAQGKVYRIVGTAQDVTDARNATLQIQYLNRIYALLSGINGLIVRVRNREELFREACRLAIEDGQFRMAWIGMVDPAGQRVQPLAWSGDAREILDRAPLGLDPASTDYGLVGEAIATGSLMLSNDIRGDDRLVLRDELQERGLQSLAVMPLVVSGRPAGVFALYSGEPGFFDTTEARLLRELAGDIAFALEHMEKSEKIDYLAYCDQLTGLPNRTLFNERVARRLAGAPMGAGHGTGNGAANGAGASAALILLDVDRFRAVNDSLGRLAGDELIRQIAVRLGQYADDTEHVARTGSNQFSLLRPGVGDAEASVDFVIGLNRACFEAPFHLADGVELRVAVKAGIALAPGDGTDPEILQRNAEAALKKAKAAGEKYLFYAPHMNEKAAEKLSLESRLQGALQREEFVLHYQPKIDLKSGAVAGVEALLRWRSPDLGLVQPLQFIPILEESGLILDVGQWVVRQAAADFREWRAAGVGAPRIAVNVSAVQLRRADFVQTLREALAPDPQEAGVDIELTESLLMENIDENVKKLEVARAMGIHIAIDDFGTGYSSLRYLAMLPAHTLKIDRSFVITMLADPNVLTLVSTVISMAHSLGLEVVAEGVDQAEQAQVLRELGCDQLQGYIASRPVPKDALLELLRDRANGFGVLTSSGAGSAGSSPRGR